MNTIPISKENKKKLSEIKDKLGLRYTYQALDYVLDVALAIK